MKNFLLFILAIALSLATATYFGTWYDQFSPQYGGWITDKADAIYFAGMFFSYVFFLPFIFQIFASGNKIKWILILLIPPTLLWILADIQHIYLPVILGLIAFGLGKIINLMVAKTRGNERIA